MPLPVPMFAVMTRFGRRNDLDPISVGRLHGLLPGPAPLDFHLEGEAEKRPDEHDASKHDQAVNGRFDGNGVDDVGRDQELQPEQNRATEVGAERRDQGLPGRAALRHPRQENS